MARRITFEVVTKADASALKNLSKTLSDLASKSAAFNKSINLNKLGREMQSLGAVTDDTNRALGRMGRRLESDLGDQADRSAKNVESLQTRVRGLSGDISRLDNARKRTKTIADQSRKAEELLARATREAADAQRRYRDVTSRKDASLEDIKEADDAYKRASQSMQKAETAVKSYRNEWRKAAQDGLDAERNIRDIEDAVNELHKTSRGRRTLTDLMPPEVLADLERGKDAVKSFTAVMNTMGKERDGLDRMERGITSVGTALDSLKPSIAVAKNMVSEIKAMAKLDVGDMRRSIGNTDAAVRQTAKMFLDQEAGARKVSLEMDRLRQSMARWAAGENATNALLRSGNTALVERQRVTRMLSTAQSQASSVATTAAKREQALIEEQMRLQREQVALVNRYNAAQSNMVRQTPGSAAQRAAIDDYERLRTALQQVDRALDQNNANLRENANVMRLASNATDSMDASTRNYRTAIQSMVSAAGQNPFRNMIQNLQQVNNFAMRMANTMANQVRSGITTAANAARSFASSAGSIFAGLQRAVQGAGSVFTRFASQVENSMNRARSSMLEMYAAGYGLMSIGRELQQFGLQGFRMMGQSLDRFMEYERARTVAGIAGAQPVDAQGNVLPQFSGQQADRYTIDSRVIDDVIFELQRGTMVPRWMEGERGRLPVTFDATELAQGLYYFSSAIGVPITRENQFDVGEVVSTMMTMAKVTNTGVETATKGIMNIAMEFGYDPRLLGSSDPTVRAQAAEDINRITAQVGMLSNVSTMEVSDIIETFKMVGPMANILSGGGQGAGLDETFLMAYLASEVGLRGGNVGRGINRAFTSLLDPTDKMLETLGVDEEGFRAMFFEPGSDTLKGGIMGFMETLATQFPEEHQASLLAELFTENATRTLVGMIGEFTEGDGLDNWLKDIGGDSNNPFRWLEAAAAESQNTISGWFDFMQNGWFQFTRSMAQSVQGPLMGGFQLIGEFLFELADTIDAFPAVGQAIAAVVTSIMSLAAVGGTVLMLAGGILLLGRSFAMLGGYVLPFIRMMAMASLTLVGLIPLFALIGTAIGLAVYAVKNNVAGLGDAFNGIKNFFSDFEGNIIPFVENLFMTMGKLADAIRIFFNSILMGGDLPAANVNSLFAGINRIFGELLGGKIITALMAFRQNLGPLREDIANFFSARTFDVSILRSAGDAVRGFMEAFFLGRMSIASMGTFQGIGQALGITNLAGQVQEAANVLRGFVSEAVNFAFQIASAWVQMSGQIYNNIARIFGGNLQGVFAGIGALVQGIMSGIMIAITSVLAGVAFVTDKIADFAEGLRAAEGAGRTFMGMAVSFEGVLRAIGIAIGLYFGARLVMMFSPLASIMATLVPMFLNFSGIIIGLGGRFLIMAAQVAISTAAFVGHIAVMAAYGAVMLAGQAANLLFGTSIALAGGSTGILSTMVAVLSAAMATLGAATAGTSGFFVLFGASVSVAAAAVFVMIGAVAIFVGVMLGIAAIITGAALAMIVWVGATQGIGAALAALGSFLQGVWTGLQFGISVLSTFIGWLHTLAGAISSVLGVGDAFSVMGFMVGAAISAIILAIVGLISALAILAVAWVAAWVGAHLLPLLAIAAIALVVVAVMKLVDAIRDIDWGSAWQGFQDAAVNAFNGVMLLMAQVVDGITNMFAEGIENIVNAAIDVASQGGIGGLPDIFTKKMEVDFGGTDFESSVRKEILSREDARTMFGDDKNMSFIVGVEVEGEEEVSGLMGLLDDIGVGGPAREFLISVGLDPNSMSFDDLSPENFMKMFTPQGMEDFDFSGDEFGFMKAYTEFQRQRSNYERTIETAERGHLDLMDFINEPFIPRFSPPEWDLGALQGGVEELDALQQKFEETKQAWADSVASWPEMSLPDMFGALYDPLAGAGGKSLIGFMAEVGDTIIANAQKDGGGQWLNMDELLADVAGSGVQIDENMAGRNIHKALEPALQIISDQTGIAMEQLLVDIPKFYAPEKYLNVASLDMVQGIADFRQQYGDTLYRELDLLGTDFILPDGTAAEQWGLDWAELNQFAISNALAGIDWNLADYIAESWGISVAEAEAYLSENNIDANAVSQEWYDGVQEAVRSNAGAYSVMTQEQFQWLSDATKEFSTNVIQMTEEEFAGMSDTMKLILTNMGYTFVLTDVVPAAAMEKARAQIQEYADVIQSLPTFLGREGANYVMEGDPADFLQVGKFTDAAGQIKYVLEDLDGTRVHIPAAEWYDYQASLLAMQNFTEQSIQAIRTGWAAIDRGYTSQGFGLIAGGQTSNAVSKALGGTPAGEGPTLKALGLLPEVKVKVNVDTGEAKKAVDQIFGTGGAAGAEGREMTIKIKADTSDYQAKMQGIVQSITGMSNNSALTEMKIKVTVDVSDYQSKMQGIVQSVGGIGSALKVEVKVTANTTEFTAAMTGLNLSSSLIPPIKIPVQPDMTNFWSSLRSGASPMNQVAGPSAGAIKIPVTGQITKFENAEQGTELTVDVAAIVRRFGGETKEMLTVDVIAQVTSFESEVLSGANIRMPVTAYVNAFESSVLTGANIRMPVTAYVNAFESDVLTGANIRMPVIAYVSSFESDVLTGANIRMPVVAYVSSFESSVLTGANIRIPVVAYIESFDTTAITSAAMSIPVTVTVTQTGAEDVIGILGGVTSAGEATQGPWAATITQSGAEVVIGQIGGATTAGQAFATTYTATIVVLGEGTVVGAIGRAMNTGRTWATTYTGNIAVTGEATVVGAIGRAINTARTFATTYTATISVNDNATGVINGAIYALQAFNGMNATATMTTVNRTINETVNMGSVLGATAATGGWRAGGQNVLVGEEGPEIVYFPRDGYVFTAPETDNMLSDPTYINPFTANAEDRRPTATVRSADTHNTYNFYGDINISSDKAARAWFDEMDRRQGEKVSLARRGMVPTDNETLW